MAAPTRNKGRQKSSGARVAALVITVLIIGAVAAYFFSPPPQPVGVTTYKQESQHVKPTVRAALPPQTSVVSPPPVVHPLHRSLSSAARSKPVKPALDGNTSARLAVIIDDMGSSLSEARSLTSINVPLTFSIIPGLRADKDVAAFAASEHIETMIHIPMQSKGWPARRLEANGLLVSMNAAELQERVAGFVRQFPGAVGANNHMGSEFTEHEEQMTDVLQVLKTQNLFFVDSATSGESVGLTVARRLGVRSNRRNVFLDNEQERGYILGQLGQAVRQARKNGSAIAICHPHPVTIATLAAALPELAGQGVRLVPVSQLVK